MGEKSKQMSRKRGGKISISKQCERVGSSQKLNDVKNNGYEEGRQNYTNEIGIKNYENGCKVMEKLI